MDHAAATTEDPHDPSCIRTQFLEELLADQERNRLGPVEGYLARFPTIQPFVLSEYAAFSCAEPAAIDNALDEDADRGRYRLIRRIAEGGMGVVYEALDVDLARRVVIKTLRPDLATNAHGLERLRREARVLGRLEHPNLAKVLELFEEEGRTHLVMPFHAGRTLADWLHDARARSEPGGGHRQGWPSLVDAEADRAQDLRRILSFFERAAAALHSAHQVGVVHRDLKPQNLLVGPGGDPVVLDFGLALPETEERLTIQGELLGTPLYMAPEQIEGAKADARTDVYALGVCLYETLTLVHPVATAGGRAAIFHRVLQGDPVPPRRHQPLIPRDLEAIVMRAIDRQPKRRYQDMAAFARDLQRVLDLEPTEARPISRIDLAWRRICRQPLLAAMTVVAFTAAAIAVWNQIRVDDMKFLAQAIEGAKTDQEVGKILQKMRERSPAIAEHLELIYPRGTVSKVSRFSWTSSPTREPQMPGIVFHYTFLAEILDGERIMASWRFQQPVDANGCVTPPPASFAAVPERTYRWRVSLADYEAVGEGTFDPKHLADCRLTVEELRKWMPTVSTTFQIASDGPAALQPGFVSAETRAQSLLDQRFIIEALSILAAPPADGTTPTEGDRRAALVADALKRLPPVRIEESLLPTSSEPRRK